MKDITRKGLELISMVCTYFGLLLMVSAPISLVANIGDPRIDALFLFLVCAAIGGIGFLLFKVRTYLENKFDIYL